MIAVIADDFSGAAELAGISRRFGLTVELCIGSVKPVACDVLIVSTDSRSLPEKEAFAVTRHVTEAVLQLQPEWIYKKTDSVLRGWVTGELEIQMEVMQQPFAFLLPANPSMSRTIKNGMYYVNGKKISETAFARDPEFPAKGDHLHELLNYPSLQLITLSDKFPGKGIAAGEAIDANMVDAWAQRVDRKKILAGAGDFFTALLATRFSESGKTMASVCQPFLYVCGTAYENSVSRVRTLQEKEPCALYSALSGKETPRWWEEAERMIREKGKMILAIDATNIEDNRPASQLRKEMARLSREIVQRFNIREMLVEGGSTATAILQELQVDALEPLDELQRGVVRMRAGSLYITVKPGSYELPRQIIELFGG